MYCAARVSGHPSSRAIISLSADDLRTPFVAVLRALIVVAPPVPLR